MDEYMLTTIDNPYDPFTQYDQWYAFDTTMGYHTCSYLDRVAITSDELSDASYQLAVQEAMDEIVSINILGLYKKVKAHP